MNNQEHLSCPVCNSPRIIYVRHDSDWGGGNSITVVNSKESYEDGDLSDEGEVVNFGDVNIFVCLACDFTWQRWGRDAKEILSKFSL